VYVMLCRMVFMSTFARSISHPTVWPSSKHTASVVLLHGLGDSGEGLMPVGHALVFPHIKFILPSAPIQPVTLNGGTRMSSWYDIEGLDRSHEKCEGLEQSSTTVRSILEEEHRRGIPYSRMMLAGFSQGGALSLWTGLQMPVEKKLAGVLVMSGYLPGADRFKPTKGLETTPILHCHGTNDAMVRAEWAEKSRELVVAKTKEPSAYDLQLFEDLGHTVDDEVIGAARDFIQARLPPLKGDL